VTGWPRLKSVVPLELLAVASRVPGVDLVRPVLVIADEDATGSGNDPISMRGLELPRIADISVLPGDPQPLAQLRGTAPPATAQPKTVVPVPVVPETC
jgi:carbohydrate-binding DOMON domain-containing protein